MTKGLYRLLLGLPMLAGCGSFQVTTQGAKNNCQRAAEISATGVSPSSLNLGSVPPPLPEGLEQPKGLIIEPQPLPSTIARDAPTVGFPDPDQKKVVVVSSSDVAAEALRKRFEDALAQADLKSDGGLSETRIGGKLTEFAFSYGGRGVRGSAAVIRCSGSSRVVVSQTIAQ